MILKHTENFWTILAVNKLCNLEKIVMRKTLYITGGNGLIGNAVCKKFMSEGYYCVSLDKLSGDNGDTKGQNFHHLFFDLSETASLREKIKSFFHGKMPKPNVWVNCGYPRTEKFALSREGSLDHSDWRANVNLQLNNTCLICSEVAREMSVTGGGSIVNVASIYGMRAPRFAVYEGTELGMPPAYSVIKAGVINYSRQLAAVYADRGVRINTISPGGVLNQQDNVFLSNYSDQVPIGRLASPEEIAAPIFFLSSEDASYITGANIPVDGGWTAT